MAIQQNRFFTPCCLVIVGVKIRRKGRFAQLLENNSDCCTFRGGKGARWSVSCARAVAARFDLGLEISLSTDLNNREQKIDCVVLQLTQTVFFK